MNDSLANLGAKLRNNEAKGSKNNQYLLYEKNGNIDKTRIIKITELKKNSFIKTGKISLFNEKTLTNPIKKA